MRRATILARKAPMRRPKFAGVCSLQNPQLGDLTSASSPLHLRFCKFLSSVTSLFLLCSSTALAEEMDITGHLKYQLTGAQYATQTPQDAVGQRSFAEHDFDFRLNTNYQQGAWFSELSAEALSTGGKQLETQRRLAAQGLNNQQSLINDKQRLFDLTLETSDEKYFASVLRLDRINVGYKTDSASAIIGRQAITWGGGLTFNVFDLFNPFSPIAIDKDYKTGDDMLYAESVVGENSEIQMLYIPRRNQDESLRAEESSAAALWRSTVDEWEFSALTAHHYDQSIFGLGFNRSIFEAVFRSDVIYETIENESNKASFVSNIDRSWTILGTNLYGFIEFFHNGPGSKESGYATISPAMQERLARGERFTSGKNYISWGGRIELQPLLELYLLHIANLHDESGAIQLRLVDDQLAQDLRLQIGTNLPYGNHGSEFGGIKIPGELFLTPAEQLFVRVSYYL